ncbi:hypothetical protein [Holdemania sp. Marseille-P2844]|uniref:hypothetical protein n=1 Tax=Holdemania sp. Marseille-P2844 TaxID=1852366 RepID=UPI001114BABD|nr:hypothetical protein [Holdemania sp. Marseille-P2844]
MDVPPLLCRRGSSFPRGFIVTPEVHSKSILFCQINEHNQKLYNSDRKAAAAFSFWYTESRKQKAESRKQKAESRKQKAESRKQKAESRKQKAESRKQVK